jgi:GNAT superfamily N-acetyltransferase
VSEVQIRPSGPDDIRALARFLWEVDREEAGYRIGAEDSASEAADIEAALLAMPPGPAFLLALDGDGAIVAVAAYSVLYPSLGHGVTRMLFLKELHVAAAVRRKGVAKALMAALARTARQLGCTRMGWNTGRDNAAARALYDGLGAERAEHLISYRLGGSALERLAASAD